jgi:hypothetical protein
LPPYVRYPVVDVSKIGKYFGLQKGSIHAFAAIPGLCRLFLDAENVLFAKASILLVKHDRASGEFQGRKACFKAQTMMYLLAN